MNSSTLNFSGRLKCAVLERGIIIRETEWQNNLILDQGMEALASVAIADLFQYGIKGTSNAATSETVTGTYTRAGSVSSAGTLTRNTGARDFTTADIGALVKCTDGGDDFQFYITGITSVTVAVVGRLYSLTAPSTNPTAGTIILYRADRTGLVVEQSSRPSRWKLSKAAADQTVTSDAQASDLTVDGTDNKKVTSATYDFGVMDIGAYLAITTSGSFTGGNYKILGVDGGVAFLDASPAATTSTGGVWVFGARGTNLAIDGANAKKVTSATYVFSAQDVGKALVVSAGTGFTVGSYTVVSISGSAAIVDVNVGTVGSTSGTWSMGVSGPFVAADVGNRIQFPSTGLSYEIASYTSAGSVEINYTDDFTTTAEGDCFIFTPSSADDSMPSSRTGTYSSDVDANGVTLSGGPPQDTKTLKRTFLFEAEPADVPINEIGLTNNPIPGNNANIRVKLASPVSLTTDQQLLVTYEFSIVFPSDNPPLTGSISGISGTGGKYAVEGAFCSGISTNGDSDLTTLVLEPSNEPLVALSADSTALSILDGGKIRTPAATVESVLITFTDHKPEYYQEFIATFDPNTGNAHNHRSLSLIDPSSQAAAFTFLFTNAQEKLSTHTLTYTFRKTWVRTL